APRAVGADAPPREAFGDVLRLPGVLPLMVVLFLVNFIGRSFTPILPLHLQRMAVPASSVAMATGALISAYSVCAALSASLLRRRPLRRRGVALDRGPADPRAPEDDLLGGRGPLPRPGRGPAAGHGLRARADGGRGPGPHGGRPALSYHFPG